VSVVPSAVEPSAVVDRPAPRPRTRAHWLILGCYLFGALLVTARLWVDPAGRMQTGDAQDVNLFAWFLRYSATAVSHGRLPALVTTTLNAPHGVNMMWNTAFLLPGVLLTPLTLLAGPQASLTLILTLSIAGSAASMYWVLRRWDATLPAAALGGAIYGFSPALLNSGTGHYHLALAIIPPLIIDALLRIITGRGRPVPTGAWMGLLTAAQLFIGEEPLVYTAIASLVLIAVIVAGHPRAVLGRVRGAALGLATGGTVVLAICAYPLWVQLRGPLHEHSILWGPWSGPIGFYVDPSANLLFHTTASAATVADYNLGLPEVLAYLGWPLIVVLVFAAIRYWRDPRVRAAAVACLLLELCNLGGGVLLLRGYHIPGWLLPYHWLQGLPMMAQVLPDRFCLLGDGAAAAVLAFSLDLARREEHRLWGWRRNIPAAVAVLAVLPLVPLPYHTAPVPPVPAGWQTAFARMRLAPDARVLVVPIPLVTQTKPMRWQATTGEPGTLIGGYFLGPSPTGQAVFGLGSTQDAAVELNELWASNRRGHVPSSAVIRSALASWRPAAVVAVTRPNSRLAQFLTGLLGRPAFDVGKVLAWRLLAASGPARRAA
jgi:hypothetical protein